MFGFILFDVKTVRFVRKKYNSYSVGSNRLERDDVIENKKKSTARNSEFKLVDEKIINLSSWKVKYHCNVTFESFNQ